MFKQMCMLLMIVQSFSYEFKIGINFFTCFNRNIRMVRLQLLTLCLVVLSTWNSVEGVAVMSVDFGSEWMKIAIVSVCIFFYHAFIFYYLSVVFSLEFPWRLSSTKNQRGKHLLQ